MNTVDIKYVYVDYFVFNNEKDKLTYNGHPKEKEVYRLVETQEPGIYAIHLGRRADGYPEFGMVLPYGMKADNAAMSYKLIEITEDNLTELPLTNEQIDQILDWKSDNNSDVFDNLREANEHAKTLQAAPLTDKVRKLDKELREAPNHYHMLVKELKFLETEDIFLYSAIRELISYAIDRLAIEMESLATQHYYDDRLGKGANIGAAMDAIEIYCTNDNFEVSNQQRDLLKGALALIREYARTQNVNTNE